MSVGFPAFSAVLSFAFTPVTKRSKSKCAALTSSYNRNNSELGTLENTSGSSSSEDSSSEGESDS